MANKGFDTDFIEQLKSKSDIAEVIRSYIPLDQKGRNFWARCPFHHEKTPSFSVNQDGQFYHCFGCGKSGDVINFVMEMESLEFMDACRLLAERAKIPMPDFRYDSAETAENRRKKERLLALMKDAARYYAGALREEKAAEHVEYVLGRGMTAETVRTFGIGASVDRYGLLRHLRARGYTAEEMTEAGVAEEKEGRGLCDALSGRLIFPIINSFGDVVAFGGRVMQKTDFAKYKNTRETSLFNKSKNLYNLNRLKQLKNEKGLSEVIMVEGYMDTVSLYQAGFKNVVASMGTSLTKDQARILKRYTDKVLICYDGDSAGQKAAVRGLEILKDEGISVRVVSLPDGLDPDEVIKRRGNDAFRACLDGAMPLIDFKLHILKRTFDLDNTEDRRAYVAAALKIVAKSESRAEQEDLLKRLRAETGITYESLLRDLEGVAAVGAEPPAAETPLPPEAGDLYVQARRFILSSVLLGKRYADGYEVEEEDFSHPAHLLIARYICRQREKNCKLQPSMLFDMVEESERQELEEVLAVGAGDFLEYEEAKKYFSDCVIAVKRRRLEKEIQAITKLFEGESDLARRKQYAALLQTKAVALTKLGR